MAPPPDASKLRLVLSGTTTVKLAPDPFNGFSCGFQLFVFDHEPKLFPPVQVTV